MNNMFVCLCQFWIFKKQWLRQSDKCKRRIGWGCFERGKEEEVGVGRKSF